MFDPERKTLYRSSDGRLDTVVLTAGKAAGKSSTKIRTGGDCAAAFFLDSADLGHHRGPICVDKHKAAHRTGLADRREFSWRRRTAAPCTSPMALWRVANTRSFRIDCKQFSFAEQENGGCGTTSARALRFAQEKSTFGKRREMKASTQTSGGAELGARI